MGAEEQPCRASLYARVRLLPGRIRLTTNPKLGVFKP